jgi:hypothetical protein
MAGSNPELRMRILSKVKESGVVKAESMKELKQLFDMADVSNTQFGKALRSLTFNYGVVRVNRPHAWGPYSGPRIFQVSYVPLAPRLTEIAESVAV